MTETIIKKEETEREKIERELRGYANLQSFMLESDEKEEVRRLRKRLAELDSNTQGDE